MVATPHKETRQVPQIVIDAVNRGWSVFPVDETKRPPLLGFLNKKREPARLAWKRYQKERANIEQIIQWQNRFNPSGWAVITGSISNLIILDGDGEAGKETFNNLGIDPHRRTGSGGLHADFKHPGWPVPTLNSKSKIELGERWPGLDIRGDGGYAVFCGRNTSGEYAWLREPGELDSLDTLPDNLRDFLGLLCPPGEKLAEEPKPTPKSTPKVQIFTREIAERALENALNEASMIGRDNACFKLAQQLHDNDYSQSEAERYCMDFARRTHTTNQKGQTELFTEEDARGKVASAYSYSAREPWSQGRRESHMHSEQKGTSQPDENNETTLSYDGIKAKLLEIIEKQDLSDDDIDSFIDFAREAGRLDDSGQAKIEGAIKDKITRHKMLSWQRFKKVMDEAAKAHQAETLNLEDIPKYRKTAAGMVLNSEDGPVPISNFAAEIVADTKVDDGAEQTRIYELEAELAGRHFSFEVLAKDFAKCDWVDADLGARAQITTGNSMKSHLVNAIKEISKETVQEHFHYAHTGWRRIEDMMAYLHAKGCVGQVGQVVIENLEDLTHTLFFSRSAYRAVLEREKVKVGQVGQVGQVNIQASVKLTGSLANYDLSCKKENLQQAIRASLKIPDLTKDTITMPLYCSIWRAPLGSIDFSVFVVGESGQGKSAIVALAQQHYGASMDDRTFPGSWESTENSLEMSMFQAADTLFGIDDFKPKGSKSDQDRLHAKADRVLRSAGNRSTRGRLDANLNHRPERRPRCLVISTGEDLPRGQSLNARCVVIAMDEQITKVGTVAAMKLTEAQQDARQGIYAQATAGYLEWLSPRIEGIQAHLPAFIAEERSLLRVEGHARAGDNVANLLLGMRCFLQYACEMDAITPEEAEDYLARCKSALIEIAGEASRENRQNKPTEQLRRLIIAAITSNRAHLVGPDGENPGLQYGWAKSVRYIERDGELEEEETFRGGGDRIGFISGDDVYLLPVAAYKAASAMGSAIGDDITTSELRLRKFLVQDGLLASTNLGTSRNTITVRPRNIIGRPEVLHVKKNILFPEDTPSDSPDPHDPPDPQPSKSASEADSGAGQVSDENTPGSSGFFDPGVNQAHNTAHFDGIPDEHRALFAQYEGVMPVSSVREVFWNAPGSGLPNGPLKSREHISRMRSLLQSGDPGKVNAAVEAMERLVEIKGRRG